MKNLDLSPTPRHRQSDDVEKLLNTIEEATQGGVMLFKSEKKCEGHS